MFSQWQAFKHALSFEPFNLVAEKAPHYVALAWLEIPNLDNHKVAFPNPNALFELAWNPAAPFNAVLADCLDLVCAHEL